MKTAIELAVYAVVYQRRAAEIWIREFRRTQDGASIRCLMFALGRVSGAMDLCYTACREAGVEMPREIVEVQSECHRLYDDASSIALMAVKN